MKTFKPLIWQTEEDCTLSAEPSGLKFTYHITDDTNLIIFEGFFENLKSLYKFNNVEDAKQFANQHYNKVLNGRVESI